MVRWALALMMIAAPALADEAPRHHRHYYRHHIYLPPERHVVEVVQPPFSGNFIINGTRFTAKHGACRSWVAGDRIRLLEGDWNARCVDAVFYNATQRSTCAMWCRGW